MRGERCRRRRRRPRSHRPHDALRGGLVHLAEPSARPSPVPRRLGWPGRLELIPGGPHGDLGCGAGWYGGVALPVPGPASATRHARSRDPGHFRGWSRDGRGPSSPEPRLPCAGPGTAPSPARHPSASGPRAGRPSQGGRTALPTRDAVPPTHPGLAAGLSACGGPDPSTAPPAHAPAAARPDSAVEATLTGRAAGARGRVDQP